MRIIISPAKKMRTDLDILPYSQIPQFIEDTKVLFSYLKDQNYEKLKSIWKCSDSITALNYKRIQSMDLHINLTPALLSYEGIQYQYMAPIVFQTDEYNYLQRHLRILSGFYGLLRPFDGVVPYRLEMQAKLGGKKLDSLYTFWNDKLAEQLFSESSCIINLASKEYSKCITAYLKDNVKLITCVFGELKDGKVIEKGTKVKMARGEMVRFMAERQITNPMEMKRFNRLNYTFSEKLSDEKNFIFIN